jgi:hypothetical protein
MNNGTCGIAFKRFVTPLVVKLQLCKERVYKSSPEDQSSRNAQAQKVIGWLSHYGCKNAKGKKVAFPKDDVLKAVDDVLDNVIGEFVAKPLTVRDQRKFVAGLMTETPTVWSLEKDCFRLYLKGPEGGWTPDNCKVGDVLKGAVTIDLLGWLSRPQPPYLLFCKVCGHFFVNEVRPDKKSCSDRCRAKLARQTKKS